MRPSVSLGNLRGWYTLLVQGQVGGRLTARWKLASTKRDQRRAALVAHPFSKGVRALGASDTRSQLA